MITVIIIIIIIVVIAIMAVAVTLQNQGSAKSYEYPYRKLDKLFTPAERSFFGVLDQAVGEHLQIFGKVRVADVITPQTGMTASKRQIAFNKISSKHFDYILCSKRGLSVLCAIELNDSSHNSKKRIARDEFLGSACESASFPLIPIKAQATYSVSEIQNILAPYLGNKSPIEKTSAQMMTECHSPKNVRECPKCSSEMLKKRATRGKNAGKEFWGCSAYPNCKQVTAIDA